MVNRGHVTDRKTPPTQAALTAAKLVEPGSLTPDPRNARLHSRQNLDAVKASLSRFGQQKPIVVGRDGVVIAGNATRAAAIELGWRVVWVVETDLTGPEAAAYGIADNRTAELAEWDEDVLGDLLREVADHDKALAEIGWSAKELEAMLAMGDPPAPPPDTAPAPHRARVHSQLGQVYDLGDHRLVCGDSRDPAVWEALLQGEVLDMVWTDPPYGVAYEGKTADKLTIKNDKLDPEALRDLLQDAFSAVALHTKPGGPVYCACPPGPLAVPFINVLEELDILRQNLIWLKDRFVLGHSDHHYRHEFILYGWVPGGPHVWLGGRKVDSVFEVPRPSSNKEHPTMKPIALVAGNIEHSSEVGDLVGEAFGGSGTTLMAAASLQRKARVIELDPVYCDVIRRRWTSWAIEQGIDPGPGALEPIKEDRPS